MLAMNEFTAWHISKPAAAGCDCVARFSGLGVAGGEFIRCLSHARAEARVRALAPPRPGLAMNGGHE